MPYRPPLPPSQQNEFVDFCLNCLIWKIRIWWSNCSSIFKVTWLRFFLKDMSSINTHPPLEIWWKFFNIKIYLQADTYRFIDSKGQTPVKKTHCTRTCSMTHDDWLHPWCEDNSCCSMRKKAGHSTLFCCGPHPHCRPQLGVVFHRLATR